MNIELVKLTVEYREQLFEMLTEWKNDIIENHTDMSPWKIWANDFHNLEYYIENLDTKENDESGWVPDTTLFCLDKRIDFFTMDRESKGFHQLQTTNHNSRSWTKKRLSSKKLNAGFKQAALKE